MPEVRFRERLQFEFEQRHEKNPRYSLRAFASFLGADHSSLSQILRGGRRTPLTRLRAWGAKLGMSREEIAVYVAAEHVPSGAEARRQEQLRHWTAEALCIVTEPAHWEIVRLSREFGFRPGCRWIAEQAGLSVDAVNMALSRLLRLRLLEVDAAGKWFELTGISEMTEPAFRKLALDRVREKAAEARIKIAKG